MISVSVAASFCLPDALALLFVAAVLVVMADRLKAVIVGVKLVRKRSVSFEQLRYDLSRMAANRLPGIITPPTRSRVYDQTVQDQVIESRSGSNQR